MQYNGDCENNIFHSTEKNKSFLMCSSFNRNPEIVFMFIQCLAIFT